MMNLKTRISTLSGALLYTLTAGHPVLADDTEVLVGSGGITWAIPNVLFIMDTSGSMSTVDNNLLADGTTDTRTRLEIVQDVFRDDLMTNNNYYGLNIGLMRFDSAGTGGYFASPMQILNSNTSSDFTDASDAFTAGGNTPLSETLYEAARFYRGMSVDFGDDTSPGTNHPDVVDNGNYISPITSACQKSYIILLTDGNPNSDTAANDSIATLTGSECAGNCLDELADYLHTTDHFGDDSDGLQTVETYTIGFTTSQTLLENTANNGGGSYIEASNSNELADAFATILNSIAGANDSFSPPAMAANAFNNISHYNKLFFTLYEPAAGPKWEGNVKPYTLTQSGSTPFGFYDADNAYAINDTDGTFLADSRSFWSDNPDGHSIAAGGANGRLPTEANRNLYTFTGSYNASGVPTSLATLSDAQNALSSSGGSNLTYNMLGLEDDTNFASTITTIRSQTLGDPLHSKPVLINYGGSEADPDLTLYVATNAGFLHAFNATNYDGRTDGQEQFAFIPQELLPNLKTLAQDIGAHPYGLDGDVTAWVNDTNGDGIIDSTDGDHAYIYVGMRRGGKNYYALDVTNRDAPVLKWIIKGGPEDEGGMADFTELGQTWSRPEVTTINYAGSARNVLIFGGGYDTAQDSNPVDQADSAGRAVFIVDADTGQRLWWAGPAGSNAAIAGMNNSIPSDVRLLDSNMDGYTDRLYVGDMDGKIFRIDLQNTDDGMTGMGIMLANLGSADDTDADDNRRFYYPPDVVLTRYGGMAPYISINIGSGYRAHPLNPTDADTPIVKDRFYSLRDPYVLGPIPDPDSFSAIDNDDLFDTSTNLIDSTEELNTLNTESRGWFIELAGNGEKVLAPSLTINGEIFFTTYTPYEPEDDQEVNDVCAPQPGWGKLYAVSLFDATPVLTDVILGGGGDPENPTAEDREKELKRRGIPPAPTAMFREKENGDVDIVRCVGTDCEKLPKAIQMEETYWRDDVEPPSE